MERRQRILFRADGNHQIGLGHVYRALALIQILQKQFDTSLAIINPPERIRILLLERGIDFIPLINCLPGSSEDIQQTLKLIINFDAIVLDGYQFGSNYQQSIFTTQRRVFVIDDLIEGEYFCDAIINPASGIDKSNYDFKNKENIFCGIEYAIVNRTFLEVAKKRTQVEILHKKIEKTGRGLITFGGADPDNYTHSIIKQLIQANFTGSLDVVIGSSYKWRDSLNEFEHHKQITIYQDVSSEKMVDLMQAVDYGICSSSTVAYEFLCCNTILFLLLTADNQKNAFDYLTTNQLATCFDQFPFVNKTNYILLYSLFNGNQDSNLLNVFKSII